MQAVLESTCDSAVAASCEHLVDLGAEAGGSAPAATSAARSIILETAIVISCESGTLQTSAPVQVVCNFASTCSCCGPAACGT